MIRNYQAVCDVMLILTPSNSKQAMQSLLKHVNTAPLEVTLRQSLFTLLLAMSPKKVKEISGEDPSGASVTGGPAGYLGIIAGIIISNSADQPWFGEWLSELKSDEKKASGGNVENLFGRVRA